MSIVAPTHLRDFPLIKLVAGKTTPERANKWIRLAKSAILITGAPRSGTTWLAKIFDSHPDVMYRHEPDELLPVDPAMIPLDQLGAWLRHRSPRVAAKRPLFTKSWRPTALETARRAVAGGLALASRTAITSQAAAKIGLLDMVAPNRWRSVRGAMKMVSWDPTLAARTLPDTRSVFILRHPCGQVASVMAGQAAQKFDSGSETSITNIAAQRALRHGVEASVFNALPDAAKYAWYWLAFNEPAVESLELLPNTKIIIYEDLCRQPDAVARSLFDFVGLPWHVQTETFLGLSTQHDQPAGYYDVYRTTAKVADRWRQKMSPSDQEAVRKVVSTSVLARCWPDLAS